MRQLSLIICRLGLTRGSQGERRLHGHRREGEPLKLNRRLWVKTYGTIMYIYTYTHTYIIII